MNILTTSHILQSYLSLRNYTSELCKPLAIEDYVIQSIDDVSPPKWHLAHTTWFFETFILIPHYPRYKIFNILFHELFNSYYQSMGTPFPRVKRGLLSRPTVKTIYAYREYVDKHLIELLDLQYEKIHSLVTLGLHHEQQHQELLLMDIKHNLSLNPEFPIYHSNTSSDVAIESGLEFINIEGGLVGIGYQGNEFCFDNELPRHQYFLNSYAIANRLTTNAEFLEFILAGGYQQPEWWLADGWECVKRHAWKTPLYWHQIDNEWFEFTLNGLKELNLNEPVSHISYYEADAFARWSKKRLPTEEEWEHFVISQSIPLTGNLLQSKRFHPIASPLIKKPSQFFGDLWEWTASSYSPYPGYQPLLGALGEYNGKFMNNQMVLRGGCCVTPENHIRTTYRNFFQPDKRWAFSGIRLASD